MGVTVHRHAGRKRVIRAIRSLRLLIGPHNAVNFLAAFVLLINSAVPYWHAAQKAQAWALAFSEPAVKHQAALDGGVECPMHSIGGGEKKGSEAPPGKKPCPLCQALQLLSPGVTQPGFAYLPCAAPVKAAFLPHRVALQTGRQTQEQGRPRAPPLA